MIKNPGTFECLRGNDVISAQISDHHPIIHDGVLLWNIMMQGRTRNHQGKLSFNNGFGLVETEKQYLSRLTRTASVIAEIVRNNQIDRIALCEGPIQFDHVQHLFKAIKEYDCLQRFTKHNQFHRPDITSQVNWGLLMLTDENDQVERLDFEHTDYTALTNALANRFQLWRLTKADKATYLALAHFPYSHDIDITDTEKLSASANQYRKFIQHILNKYEDEQLIFCADFNFNPYLISKWKERALDQITHHNSLILNTDESHGKRLTKTVTVDGILLSIREKQKLNPSLVKSKRLFKRLKEEWSLLKSYINLIALPDNENHIDSLIDDYIIKNKYAL
jgi:hypothetical protein